MIVISKEFEKTLNYCMYICDEDDKLYWELQYISTKLILGDLSTKDCDRLYKIEKILQKNLDK